MFETDEWTGIPDPLLLDGDPSPAAITPSGWLAVELDQYFSDPPSLSDPALVDAIVGFERLVGWAQARQARLIASLAERRTEPGSVTNWAADEVAAVLHQSSGTAAFRTRQASALVDRLPATLAAWEAGLLDQRRVTAITDATATLTSEHAALVEARVLPRAPQQTAAQLRAALKRAIIAVDPDGAQERHERARKGRRVAVNPEPDGMASLWALLPAPDAVASFAWLTRLARGCGGDDPRSMDERRADLLADLLSGRLRNPDQPLPAAVNPGKPLVQVVMPMTALFGLTDDPSELLGYGPITAGMAREIAATATWRRLLFDPASGAFAGSRPHHLHPTRRARRLRQGPGCALPVPRLPARGGQRRARPHPGLCRRRVDQRDQPGRVLRAASPPQTRRRRLAGPRVAGRRVGVDHPDRAGVRDPALRLPRRPRPTLNRPISGHCRSRIG